MLDVLIIGAGFAGICTAIKLRAAGYTDFRIVEKHRSLGGTWYANTYPGATCDVPSHFYSFSFAPNPNWSRLYSPQPEILAYIEDCADKYGVRPHIDFETEVSRLSFDEKGGFWTVEFNDRPPVQARFVVNGMGGLHVPLWPDIAGLDQFQGPVMHTAQWNHDFDPAGKRIAVIGSAASAIQVVPRLAKVADRIDLYQRTPNYIAPRGDFAYSDRQKRLFNRFPVWQRLYRRVIMQRMDWLLYPLVHSPGRRAFLADRIGKYLGKVIKDPELRARLEPDYELGCKRILVSDDFYPSLNRKNVDVITEGIGHVSDSGIHSKAGQDRQVDAIILATGFDIQSQFTAVETTGANGRRLDQVWRDKVEAYRGIMISGFPNLFLVTGPNSGVGTTSVVFMIEQAVGWIIKAISMVPDGATLDVRPEAQSAYNRALHADLDTTVWATSCSSWYKRPDGRIETLYPGSAAAYARDMRRPKKADLVVRPAPPTAPNDR